MMQGLMMDYPLTLTHFLERAQRLYAQKEIVSKTPVGIHRYTYGDLYARVCRLANVLHKLGIRKGDRVATFAWNSYRHLELYLAIPCVGAVLHTINIRLFPQQIAYIFNHAEDKACFVDESLLPLLEPIKGQLKSVKNFVVMSDKPAFHTGLSPASDYEMLLQQAPAHYDFPQLDEQQAAGICYTSGTTGEPKGVLYSHRALVLHTLVQCLADSFGICERDVVLPAVPMFHANAWGLTLSCTMLGAKQVFTGPFLQPRDIAQLIQDERVTLAAGVPTIWIGLYQLLKKEKFDISSLRTMPVGGSAMPQSLIEAYQKDFNIPIAHSWGMTELSPVGTVSKPKSYLENIPEAEYFKLRAKQGIPVPFVEIRGMDEGGNEIPWDGVTIGELQVRGPWVVSGYYNDPRSPDSFQDGWFRTGDVVVIDKEGYIQIVDRTKDVVKSGGEWISSVDLENAIMAHPKVLEAAVIGVAHPKWSERPLACVVPTEDAKGSITRDEIIEFLSDKVAKWWLPDDIVILEAIPRTSVGKFDKKTLRHQFRDHQWPE
ncbi:long-chain fatty acid--CoA ligase [Candidatus Acetothermia bacterium]|nr:long-chain fatty acid--CoA ligase [Candidatus Acetothermia bacterium]MBI3643334.1 long-chain fatty acid--CoA ligase [Candidatus Acetothermia bacterium]